VSRLSRKYGNLDVSQPYGPPRHVTGIPLLLSLTRKDKSFTCGDDDDDDDDDDDGDDCATKMEVIPKS
jgi:hypothetical protein